MPNIIIEYRKVFTPSKKPGYEVGVYPDLLKLQVQTHDMAYKLYVNCYLGEMFGKTLFNKSRNVVY